MDDLERLKTDLVYFVRTFPLLSTGETVRLAPFQEELLKAVQEGKKLVLLPYWRKE